MTARQVLPSDYRELGRSLVPIALLALGAGLPIARIPVLVLLVAGTFVAISRDAPVRWTWAGAVPVAVSLVIGAVLVPPVAADGADCADPVSPVAAWRAIEAIVVLTVAGTLAIVLRASRSSLYLRRPANAVVRWSILGFLVSGPAALLVGPFLARPFFGVVSYDVTVVGAVLPALVFAVANGVMEELIYRGTLLGWSARVMGAGPAVIGQAIVFGLAHSGPDVIGSPVPLMLALGAGGLAAGVIAVRTRSLLLPMAIHIGLDIPIYYAFACAG